jgi:hypothetical protein
VIAEHDVVKASIAHPPEQPPATGEQFPAGKAGLAVP